MRAGTQLNGQVKIRGWGQPGGRGKQTERWRHAAKQSQQAMSVYWCVYVLIQLIESMCSGRNELKVSCDPEEKEAPGDLRATLSSQTLILMLTLNTDPPPPPPPTPSYF